MDNKNGRFLKEVFTWSIPKFSEIAAQELNSEQFRFQGIPWRVQVGVGNNHDYIGIHLENMVDPHIEETHEIWYTVTILDQLEDKKSFSRAWRQSFESGGRRGWSKFISLKSLNDVSHGYLVGDTLQLQVCFEVRRIESLKVDTSMVALGSKLWEFREEKLGTDVTIVTSTKSLCAHLVVLMVASPVLKAMFSNPMIESQTRCIEMREFSCTAVEQFLEFVYTLELPIDGSESLCVAQLWAMGDKYMVPGLIERVEGLHKNYITTKNVVSVFIDADAFEAGYVKTTCLEVIGKNLEEFVTEIKRQPPHIQESMQRQLVAEKLFC